MQLNRQRPDNWDHDLRKLATASHVSRVSYLAVPRSDPSAENVLPEQEYARNCWSVMLLVHTVTLAQSNLACSSSKDAVMDPDRNGSPERSPAD